MNNDQIPCYIWAIVIDVIVFKIDITPEQPANPMICDSKINNIPIYSTKYSLVNRLWKLGCLYDHIEVYILMLVNEII